MPSPSSSRNRVITPIITPKKLESRTDRTPLLRSQNAADHVGVVSPSLSTAAEYVSLVCDAVRARCDSLRSSVENRELVSAERDRWRILDLGTSSVADSSLEGGVMPVL